MDDRTQLSIAHEIAALAQQGVDDAIRWGHSILSEPSSGRGVSMRVGKSTEPPAPSPDPWRDRPGDPP